MPGMSFDLSEDQELIRTAVAELAAIVAGEQRGPAFWAATLLGRLGLAASDAKPALQQAVASSLPEVSRRAAWALEKISAR